MAAKANFCCAIELEPRTLNQGQLNHAREIAADAVLKVEEREISSILLKGFRDMDQIEETGDQFQPEILRPPIDKNNKEGQLMIEGPCQCSVVIDEFPTPSLDEMMNFKEPVTAPF